jgi:hypothetical protein
MSVRLSRRNVSSGAAAAVVIPRTVRIGSPNTRSIGQTVVCARLSSADQRPDLDLQVARVTEWASGRRLPVDRVVTEVGSAHTQTLTLFIPLHHIPCKVADSGLVWSGFLDVEQAQALRRGHGCG